MSESELDDLMDEDLINHDDFDDMLEYTDDDIGIWILDDLDDDIDNIWVQDDPDDYY